MVEVLVIEVELDQTDDWPKDTNWEALAKGAVDVAFAVAGFAPAGQISVSINLSDNDEVQALNAQWRGKDKPTNVLSFPMLDGEELAQLNPPRNGEVARSDGGVPPLSGAQSSLRSHPSTAYGSPPPRAGEELLLGDLILAHTVCATEAVEKQIPLPQHVTHLIIHGTLHLLGLDHIDDAEAEHMEALEVKALASLGLPNPYSD
jgi:probable rRNA maturation factor